ncbi:MAG: hypothetical protein AB1782_16685 [Cyanobacteriota bacterium]
MDWYSCTPPNRIILKTIAFSLSAGLVIIIGSVVCSNSTSLEEKKTWGDKSGFINLDDHRFEMTRKTLYKENYPFDFEYLRFIKEKIDPKNEYTLEDFRIKLDPNEELFIDEINTEEYQNNTYHEESDYQYEDDTFHSEEIY